MTPKEDSLRELINKATQTLAKAAVDSPRLSAEVLMAHCLSLDSNAFKLTLITAPQTTVPPQQIERFRQLCQERLKGVPVAYLIGEKEFFGLEFTVTPDTLIPRPDTELLVELALKTANELSESFPFLTQEHLPAAIGKEDHSTSQQRLDECPPYQKLNQTHAPKATSATGDKHSPAAFHFADLGTGTGCIAVCLALHLKEWHGTALDISEKALEVARSNALRHNISSLVFTQGTFQSLPFPPRSLHLIVSNPPYISSQHYATLNHEVRGFEPQSALIPGTFQASAPAVHAPYAVASSSNSTSHTLCGANSSRGNPQKTNQPQTPSWAAHTCTLTDHSAPSRASGPSPRTDANGLEDFFTIVEQAEKVLIPNGYLLFEMGFDQASDLHHHFQKRLWQDISVHQDLAGHDRVIKARWPGPCPL